MRRCRHAEPERRAGCSRQRKCWQEVQAYCRISRYRSVLSRAYGLLIPVSPRGGGGGGGGGGWPLYSAAPAMACWWCAAKLNPLEHPASSRDRRPLGLQAGASPPTASRVHHQCGIEGWRGQTALGATRRWCGDRRRQGVAEPTWGSMRKAIPFTDSRIVRGNRAGGSQSRSPSGHARIWPRAG